MNGENQPLAALAARVIDEQRMGLDDAAHEVARDLDVDGEVDPEHLEDLRRALFELQDLVENYLAVVTDGTEPWDPASSNAGPPITGGEYRRRYEGAAARVQEADDGE